VSTEKAFSLRRGALEWTPRKRPSFSLRREYHEVLKRPGMKTKGPKESSSERKVAWKKD